MSVPELYFTPKKVKWRIWRSEKPGGFRAWTIFMFFLHLKTLRKSKSTNFSKFLVQKWEKNEWYEFDLTWIWEKMLKLHRMKCRKPRSLLWRPKCSSMSEKLVHSVLEFLLHIVVDRIQKLLLLLAFLYTLPRKC